MSEIEHNPLGDDRVPLPEEYRHLADLGVTAHRYGNSVFLKGGSYSTAILDEILRRRNNQESVVITITAGPGSGKTYMGIALAQILDKRFHCSDTPEPPPIEDSGQIVFTRAHLTHLVSSESPLKRGQVILLDESHFGIGARDWQNRDQKDLVNLLAAVRSRGYILILIVLHSSMIDKIVRAYVVNYEFHMSTRGTAIVYRRWFPQFGSEAYSKRLGLMTLPLPDHQLCNYPTCLGCQYLHKPEGQRCKTIRAVYERRKSEFLDEASKAANVEPVQTRKTGEEILEILHESRNSMYLNKDGALDVHSIQAILEHQGLPHGKNTAYSYRDRYTRAHPEITAYLEDRLE